MISGVDGASDILRRGACAPRRDYGQPPQNFVSKAFCKERFSRPL
jgi:hypothetical protein